MVTVNQELIRYLTLFWAELSFCLGVAFHLERYLLVQQE